MYLFYIYETYCPILCRYNAPKGQRRIKSSQTCLIPSYSIYACLKSRAFNFSVDVWFLLITVLIQIKTGHAISSKHHTIIKSTKTCKETKHTKLNLR